MLKFSRSLATLLAIALSSTASAYADVFKCPSSDGKITYGDKPCPVGVVGTKVLVPVAPTPQEVNAARQLAYRNSNQLKAVVGTPPVSGVPAGLEKMINNMKMNDIRREESLRESEKRNRGTTPK